MRKFKYSKATFLAAAISAVNSGYVLAQEQTPDNQSSIALEEVIVTAQKRSQNLQEVPVAVTALTAGMLEQAGISNIVEIERISPNTTLRPSRATNTTLTAYIRGIGQNDPLWGFEPGVGLYIDDIYIARPQGAMVDVYDVERIEILRGPQGTLYGKNTIGGAIKYVTKKMSGEAQGEAKLSFGSYRQQDVMLTGQLPIMSDTLFVGGTFATFKRDGFGTNLFDDGENYNKDIVAGRLSVEWNPSEDLFIRVAGDMSEDRSNAKQGTRLVTSLQTGEAPQETFNSNAGLNSPQLVENSGANITVDWSISDSFSVKSITAYREGQTDSVIDFDATPLNTFDAPVTYSDHQTTQEFQLTFEGEKLKVVGGLYYYEGFASGAFDVVAGAGLGLSPEISGRETHTAFADPLFEAAPGVFLPWNPVTNDGPTFVAATKGSANTKSQAAYFHATYDLLENLSFTLGARYTKDKKDADVFKAKFLTDGLSTEFGGTNFAQLSLASDFTEDGEWSQVSPKFGVDWNINDDNMVYYSYAEGFKSGGINMRADVANSPAGLSQVFDPETAKTHEVGIKSEMANGRLRVNAALFTTAYDNVQVTTNRLFGTNFVPLVITDNEQEIQGAEMEANFQISEGLSMMLNIGWVDAEWTAFTDFDSEGVAFDASNTVIVSNTPEFAGLLGFNYDLEMGDSGKVVFGFNVSYTDEIAPEIVADAPINADSYSLVGLSAIWYSADESWTAALHGKNLTNEEYLVAGYNFANFLGEDSITGFYGDPRTVTLSLGYKF